jgi:indolepyruvate ferredoxin oxidoreductase beta subunit
MNASRSINVAVLAMGGEGGGVLADWLVDLAEHQGWVAQATSVPGVAQRTGATIYYLELVQADRAGRQPVLALMPFPGDVDVVVASELMEAGRAIQRGLVTPERTTLIASTHRVYSMSEKTAMGDGRVDSSMLLESGRAAAKRFLHADFAAAAEETGSVISAVLFGALAESGALPFAREAFEAAIQRGGVGVESSLRAFALGAQLVREPAPTQSVQPDIACAPALGPRLAALAQRIDREFPLAAHGHLREAVRRLADYQDVAYASEYLDRLVPVREADARYGDGRHRLLAETARYLALWMSYEDTVRVADLKTRRARFERVKRETRLREGQQLAINEYLHPRVEEIADMLPAGLGGWLLSSRWAHALVRRFLAKGRVIRTSSVRGYLALYCIAGLRPWRRRSLRYQRETARMREWLNSLLAAAARDYELALVIAECQRLIKGYSDTHARGTKNFDALMRAAVDLGGRSDAAVQLRRLREAALADDTGAKLDAELGRLRLATTPAPGRSSELSTTAA